MGQDQGVYQTNALLMVEGLESNVVQLKEFNLMLNDEDKQLFLDTMDTHGFSGGFDPIYEHESRGAIPPGTYPINSGVFYGLPNFPALLSISGLIFGSENIMHGLTLPYLIAIVLLFITLNLNLGLSKSTSLIVTLIFAISPMVLWTSKASLTEIYLAMLISMFCFYLTDRESIASWLLWIPVSTFAFFHVSIYTVMPMFIVLFIGLILIQQDLGAWFSGILSIVLYGVGYIAMSFSSPAYTFKNYMRMFKILERINFDFQANSSQFTFIIPFCIIALCIFAGLYYYSFNKKKTVPNLSKYIPYAFVLTTIACLGVFLYNWIKIASTVPNKVTVYNSYYGGGFINTIPNLTLFSIAFGSGFLLLTLIMVHIFRRSEFLFSKNTIPITFMLLYCVVFINTTLNLYVAYYYYFSRYVVPYIPIIIVLGGIALDRIKRGGKYTVAAVSVGVLMPFATTLAINTDISYMDINSQSEILASMDCFESDSIIILEDDLERFLFNVISFQSDSYVFPKTLYNKITDKSFENGRQLYYISTTSEQDDLSIFKKVAEVQSGKSFLDYWFTGWDDGPIRLLQPNVNEFWIKVEEVNKSEVDIKRIDMSRTYALLINNNNRFENNGEVDFLWSSSESSFEFIFNANEDYYFQVNHLRLPGVEDLNLWFYIDSSLYMNHVIVDNSATSFEFFVPKELLEGRVHIIHMIGDTWQPSGVLGTEDKRELGIPITSIEAVPASRRS